MGIRKTFSVGFFFTSLLCGQLESADVDEAVWLGSSNSSRWLHSFLCVHVPFQSPLQIACIKDAVKSFLWLNSVQQLHWHGRLTCLCKENLKLNHHLFSKPNILHLHCKLILWILIYVRLTIVWLSKRLTQVLPLYVLEFAVEMIFERGRRVFLSICLAVVLYCLKQHFP